MKAMVYPVYGPADVLELQELEKPSPENDEILIRIQAAVVTRTDCETRNGEPLFARLFTGLLKPKTTILGFELAGEIEATGKDVTRYKVGDQIYGSTTTSLGAHAEYLCQPEKGGLAIKPTNISFEEAVAIVEGALTALPFLRDKANVQSGQKVLINGASGSIGTAAVQLAKYFGAEVTGVCSAKNFELVKSLGADKVIDYTQEDFTRDGQTYDVIFDPIGKSSFSRCKDSLTETGIYLTAVLGLTEVVQTAWTSKIGRKKAILALTGLRSAADKTEDLRFLKELIEAGKLRAVIDRCYPLEQAAEAHRHVETGHKRGNVVLTIGHNGKN